MVEFSYICKVVEAPGKAGDGVGSPEWDVKTRDGSIELKYRVKVRRDGGGRGLRVERGL